MYDDSEDEKNYFKFYREVVLILWRRLHLFRRQPKLNRLIVSCFLNLVLSLSRCFRAVQSMLRVSTKWICWLIIMNRYSTIKQSIIYDFLRFRYIQNCMSKQCPIQGTIRFRLRGFRKVEARSHSIRLYCSDILIGIEYWSFGRHRWSHIPILPIAAQSHLTRPYCCHAWPMAQLT